MSPAPSRLLLPAEVSDIYLAIALLQQRYPIRTFTPDGHLVGSIGEVIAAQAFGLTLLPMSAPGHDALDPNGRHVQIKLTGGDRVALRADCDRLIVLRIVSPSEAEVVYDGPGAPVWAAAGKMRKNGQRPISLASLRAIAGESAR